MERYYIVNNGEVTAINMCDREMPENCNPDTEGTEWIIVYAEDEKDALQIADNYDAGLAEYGNTCCIDCGKTHAAVV